MNLHFGANVVANNTNYGLATYSKYKIIDEKHIYLSSTKEQRGFLDTTIKVKNKKVHIINVHLGLNDKERKKQIKELEEYLRKLLHKEAFDKKGLIYGMGHAVYTISDPREKILKSYAKQLASEKGLDEEFALYDRVERIAGEEIMTHRKMLKPVCANVDFYSGFVYTMLNIPEELFTPLFAIARITGWSAHRLEELLNAGKIIRPAYKYVGQHTEFHNRDDRN